MTVINTNVGALNARTYAINASKKIDDNMKKLSSGLRVTSGSDDAAGLAVANKLESQLRSTNMSIQNAANGISLIQTAGSGMNKVQIQCSSELEKYLFRWPMEFIQTKTTKRSG